MSGAEGSAVSAPARSAPAWLGAVYTGTRVPRFPFPARLLSPSLGGVLLAVIVFAGAPAAATPLADELAAKAQQGKEAMAAGRFDEAATLYAAIVQALPNEPGMRMNLGMALSMAGRPREAIPHLQAALRLNPDLLPAALFLGAAYTELGQPAKAVEPLQKFVAAQPDHREARQMLADALLTLDRWEPAAHHYRTLTQQAPDDPKAWYGLERSYEGLSRRAFETLQETAPESPYLSLLVAEAMVARERDKSAFPLYREAIAKKTRPCRGPRGPGPDLRAQRARGLGRGRAREGEGDPAARLPDADPGVRVPGRPVREGPRDGPAARHRGEPLLDLPRRRRARPRGLRPPHGTASLAGGRARAGRGPPRAEALRPVEGGAAEGRRGLAGGPRGSAGSRRPSTSSPTSTRRPGRSSRSC